MGGAGLYCGRREVGASIVREGKDKTINDTGRIEGVGWYFERREVGASIVREGKEGAGWYCGRRKAQVMVF